LSTNANERQETRHRKGKKDRDQHVATYADAQTASGQEAAPGCQEKKKKQEDEGPLHLRKGPQHCRRESSIRPSVADEYARSQIKKTSNKKRVGNYNGVEL